MNDRRTVLVRGLRKAFADGTVAVDGLDLDLFRGEISVVLGHNGAGKSTTIALLTGLLGATSGTAEINGNDIGRQMDDIRRSLGICPQQNVLFMQLTVLEHLRFFGVVKPVAWCIRMTSYFESYTV